MNQTLHITKNAITRKTIILIGDLPDTLKKMELVNLMRKCMNWISI